MQELIIATRQGSERKLGDLTRDAVIAASKYFRWNKQLPKWTVVVDGTAFPVRPLTFRAAGLLPNAAATTHQAVAKLKQLGFQVFYEGNPPNWACGVDIRVASVAERAQTKFSPSPLNGLGVVALVLKPDFVRTATSHTLFPK